METTRDSLEELVDSLIYNADRLAFEAMNKIVSLIKGKE